MRSCSAVAAAILFLTVVGCGGFAGQDKPIAPIDVSGPLKDVDLCKAIPAGNIESVLGRKLVSASKRFEHPDVPGSTGCEYDSGKDANRDAFFGYVVIGPAAAFNKPSGAEEAAVPGIGRSAWFINGADARQLWVVVDDRVGLMVAFGDRPDEKGAKAIARQVVAAIK